MNKANIDIREYADRSSVYLYEVAHKLGLQDSNFSKLLRFELPEQKKREIFNIIDDLCRRQHNVAN